MTPVLSSFFSDMAPRQPVTTCIRDCSASHRGENTTHSKPPPIPAASAASTSPRSRETTGSRLQLATVLSTCARVAASSCPMRRFMDSAAENSVYVQSLMISCSGAWRAPCNVTTHGITIAGRMDCPCQAQRPGPRKRHRGGGAAPTAAVAASPSDQTPPAHRSPCALAHSSSVVVGMANSSLSTRRSASPMTGRMRRRAEGNCGKSMKNGWAALSRRLAWRAPLPKQWIATPALPARNDALLRTAGVF